VASGGLTLFAFARLAGFKGLMGVDRFAELARDVKDRLVKLD
jgi:hypothetical protein